MQTLAQNGQGVAAYIDTLSEARKVLVDQVLTVTMIKCLLLGKKHGVLV